MPFASNINQAIDKSGRKSLKANKFKSLPLDNARLSKQLQLPQIASNADSDDFSGFNFQPRQRKEEADANGFSGFNFKPKQRKDEAGTDAETETDGFSGFGFQPRQKDKLQPYLDRLDPSVTLGGANAKLEDQRLLQEEEKQQKRAELDAFIGEFLEGTGFNSAIDQQEKRRAEMTDFGNQVLNDYGTQSFIERLTEATPEEKAALDEQIRSRKANGTDVNPGIGPVDLANGISSPNPEVRARSNAMRSEAMRLGLDLTSASTMSDLQVSNWISEKRQQMDQAGEGGDETGTTALGAAQTKPGDIPKDPDTGDTGTPTGDGKTGFGATADNPDFDWSSTSWADAQNATQDQIFRHWAEENGYAGTLANILYGGDKNLLREFVMTDYVNPYFDGGVTDFDSWYNGLKTNDEVFGDLVGTDAAASDAAMQYIGGDGSWMYALPEFMADNGYYQVVGSDDGTEYTGRFGLNSDGTRNSYVTDEAILSNLGYGLLGSYLKNNKSTNNLTADDINNLIGMYSGDGTGVTQLLGAFVDDDNQPLVDLNAVTITPQTYSQLDNTPGYTGDYNLQNDIDAGWNPMTMSGWSMLNNYAPYGGLGDLVAYTSNGRIVNE